MLNKSHTAWVYTTVSELLSLRVDPWPEEPERSHGIELRGGLRRLDLHLSHLELCALQPFAQSKWRNSRCLALQVLVVHSVLDGLETQLQPSRQMLTKDNDITLVWKSIELLRIGFLQIGEKFLTFRFDWIMGSHIGINCKESWTLRCCSVAL